MADKQEKKKRKYLRGLAGEDKRLTDFEWRDSPGSCFNTSDCATNGNHLTGKPITCIRRGQEGERQQNVSYNLK